jgi:hypothetical protein
VSERERVRREERERQVIVWSCWVSSLGILEERDRGKESGRE